MIDKTKGIAEIPEWFHGSRLNFAENLLKYNDDRVAIYAAGSYGLCLDFFSQTASCVDTIFSLISTPSAHAD